jgi:hypothetical protein
VNPKTYQPTFGYELGKPGYLSIRKKNTGEIFSPVYRGCNNNVLKLGLNKKRFLKSLRPHPKKN